MKKEKLLTNLKVKCQTLMAEQTKSTKKQIYATIMKILDTPNAFNFIDAGTSLNVLIDLGYSKEEAVKIYEQLII